MIEAKNIYKSFGPVEVLKGLSLHVRENSTTVILGRSGAGKSVLLRHISGLDEPDSGQIIIKGLPLYNIPIQQREELLSDIGILFQGSALFDSLSIEENVAFALNHNPRVRNKIKATECTNYVDEALTKVGLAGFQKAYPSELSGGQRRRAALARLIVYKPSILLFDEPTTGLDPITAMQISLLIRETQRALQATCVVVTHDINAALSIGDHFAFHQDGIISTTGDKHTFFQDNNPILRHMLRCATVPLQLSPEPKNE